MLVQLGCPEVGLLGRREIAEVLIRIAQERVGKGRGRVQFQRFCRVRPRQLSSSQAPPRHSPVEVGFERAWIQRNGPIELIHRWRVQVSGHKGDPESQMSLEEVDPGCQCLLGFLQ